MPSVVLVFSGKRKSGKDYVTDKLHKLVGSDKCSVIRLSAPLKQQYSKENGLDYNMLLSSSSYKERFRDDMIKWGEKKRDANPNYFCDLACLGNKKSVWIISDARRHSDIVYFRERYSNVYFIRITASNEIREKRGWQFVKGIDDCDSECALDHGVEWDYVIVNNEQNGTLNESFNKLLTLINRCS